MHHADRSQRSLLTASGGILINNARRGRKLQLGVLVAVAVLLFLMSGVAPASPVIYKGTLTLKVPVTGSVSGFGWFDDDATNVDFWVFTGTSGDHVNIRGTRLDAALDLSLSLYLGVTSADEALFVHDASWGGLTLLARADDEIEVRGPFGDPLLSDFVLPFTGNYTIAIGGFASASEGPFPYSLSVIGAVPAPATVWLLVLGALCLLALGAKQQRLRNYNLFSKQLSK